MSECPNKCTIKIPAMVEVPGVYDGGLFLHCEVCKLSWHRWEDETMRHKAQPFIDRWNKKNGHTV